MGFGDVDVLNFPDMKTKMAAEVFQPPSLFSFIYSEYQLN